MALIAFVAIAGLPVIPVCITGNYWWLLLLILTLPAGLAFVALIGVMSMFNDDSFPD